MGGGAIFLLVVVPLGIIVAAVASYRLLGKGER